jgi:hypothetical protein
MNFASNANRRRFLSAAARTAGAALAIFPGGPFSRSLFAEPSPSSLYSSGQPSIDDWQRTWDAAVAVLIGNLRRAPGYDKPLLFEGSTYQGIWLECGPHEGLVYASFADVVPTVTGLPTPILSNPIQAAVNNHMAFFRNQRPDGQFPASIKTTENGFGQIQMVVPIAATALELFHITRDEPFLTVAYSACSKWDLWLRRYRDMRKTGLVEGFCTYDTGQDNSPRWNGIPNRCPDADARKCPPIASLPRLCPDLSATVYGGRVALAQMAKALGKSSEADRWRSDAESIRQLIIDKLYSPEDAAFYDLDAQGKFVRVRSDVISRVLGEHVLNLSDKRDKAIFQSIWQRQLHNSSAFWAPYPFPSIAMDDPAGVRPIPPNSWGGASQALTALRAPRWMTHYGKSAELRQLMHQWCAAIARNDDFRQQLDPLTGEFTLPDPGGYSPTALVFLSFARELGFERRSVGQPM